MAERKLTITILGDASSGRQALDQVGASAGVLEAKVGGLEGTFAKVSQVASGFLLGSAIQRGPGVLLGLSSSAASLELQVKKAATVFGEETDIPEIGLSQHSATTPDAVARENR